MKKVVKFVPIWKRIVAYVFDSLLISVIIVSPLMTQESENISEFINLIMNVEFWIASGFIAVLTLVYWTFLEWKYGQSIGKVLMKLKVVNVNEKEITFWQALVRNVSKLSSIILFLDVLYMLIGKGYQRFFERISDTKVVEVVENE